MHVLREGGLEASLLERNFWYDVMLMGPWNPYLLKAPKPAAAHTAAAAGSGGPRSTWYLRLEPSLPCSPRSL